MGGGVTSHAYISALSRLKPQQTAAQLTPSVLKHSRIILSLIKDCPQVIIHEGCIKFSETVVLSERRLILIMEAFSSIRAEALSRCVCDSVQT